MVCSTNKTDGHDIHHVVEILLNTDRDIVEATWMFEHNSNANS
jgi:hypothetical protein